MHNFRVYLLGGDNRIADACWVAAADLDGAIDEVRERFDCPCEIWDGPKRLSMIDAAPRRPAAIPLS